MGLSKLLRMSLRNIRHHFLASMLQICTIAATSSFLTFVLGEMIAILLSRKLPTAVTDVRGKMAHLIWILVISLLVCTISNIVSMLLNVTKRFREIGTMKCLGAFDRSILALFMVESVIIGGVGALSGAILGGMVALLSALVTHGTAVFTTTMISWMLMAIGAAVLIVMALSLVGAIYPAQKASKMLPVEAMRRT